MNDSVITPLACTVRTCGLPLTRRERAYFCPSGHAFDIARSGYVNLLQPQDRRSSKPGDSKAAVEARSALERASVGSAVIAAVIEKVPAGLPAGAVVVETGSVISHAAIVSRELGIPAAVSVNGATRRIRDGATITVDGSTGTVLVH